jgi:hypothetical protein
MHVGYIENRLQTMKIAWGAIQEIRKKNGFCWDDNLKMITYDSTTYAHYIQV